MNEPIISPLWIYLIECLDNIGFTLSLINVFFVAGIIVAIIMYIVWKATAYDPDYESDVESDKKVRPTLIKCIVGCLVSMLICTTIPSEKTMYAMLAASYITEENIDKAGNTVTDMVDYIFDKVDELQNDEVQEGNE